MYYIKVSPNADASVIGITRSNVYCLCPRCGREVPVDLQSVLNDEGFRLEGSSVMCGDCSRRELEQQYLQERRTISADRLSELFMEVMNDE